MKASRREVNPTVKYMIDNWFATVFIIWMTLGGIALIIGSITGHT